MFKTDAITLDFKSVDRPRTKADFTYQISPATIEIVDTGQGKLSVADDLDAVMRRIEYWHMDSVGGFKISYRDENAVRHEVQWDGQRALVSPANQAGSQS
jgi:YD repeat-containing protein